MLIVTLPVLALIMAQDDFGTMLVFLAIFGGIFLMSGISWRIIVPVIALAVLVGAGTIFFVTTDGGRELLYKVGFKSYQFARIDSWLDPFPRYLGYELSACSRVISHRNWWFVWERIQRK